ncbi:MAG TPA: ATP-binding protein [Gemmatimonadaceae bacterium]|nr:ATP-binding protein [Gemmatimonadaceae bacterium]
MTGSHKQIANFRPEGLSTDGAPTAPIRRKLGAAFGAAALVLLVGLVSLVAIQQLVAAFGGVSRSTHVATELRRVVGGFHDAESGLRGYLLTTDDRLLTQYRVAVESTRTNLGHLLADVSDDSRSAADSRELRVWAEQKFAAMDSLLSLAATAGADSAASALRGGLGQDEMDSVRTVIRRLQVAEGADLADSADERDRNTRLALLVVGGGTLLAFLLLVAVLMAVRREIIHEARLQGHLVEQTQRLDAQATELELQNEQLQDQAVALEEQSSKLEEQQTELEAANDELMNANVEVESSRERLRLLLDSAESGMYGIDEQGKCTFINPAAARMLGYEQHGLVGEMIHDRVHYAHADGSPYPFDQCPIRKALITGSRVRRDDEVYWRKDGSCLSVDYTAAPMLADGKVRGAVVSFLDITDRKRESEIRTFLADATEALNSSLDYHSTLRTVATLAVPRLGDWCAVDMMEDGKLERLAVVHRDPEKLNMVLALTKKRPPRLDAPMGSGKVIRTGRAELIADIPEEVLVASAEGDVQLIQAIQKLDLRSLLGVPLMSQGEAIGAIICVMAESGRRFTEQDLQVAEDLASRASLAIENALLYKEAEVARKRAEAADSTKSQFLAAMSHELRTPLNAIAGYAELIAVGVHGPVTDKQKEALERITRSQKTLLSLINDILNFSKLEAGFIQVAADEISMATILDALEGWIEPQLRSKQLRFSYDSCPEDLHVRGDRDKIQQVMLNLLSNAVKFTPHGGNISVTCTFDDSEVRINVRDTGPGIPPDKVDVIFEPFVQVDRGVQSTYQGTGLGLAISRDLARAMKGNLVVGRSTDSGSEFVFSLPRIRPAGTDAGGKEPSTAPAKSRSG